MGKRKNDIFYSIGIILIISMAVLLLCLSSLTASELSKPVFYDYSAKNMSFDRKAGITIFEGDAKLKVRDSEDYLNADKITIYRDIETSELIKMVAEGNVDMNQQGMKANCERAIFYEKEERIELEGTEESPAIVDDQRNRMLAPAITFFRGEDRIEAKGNVKGYVTIKGKEGKTATEEVPQDKVEE